MPKESIGSLGSVCENAIWFGAGAIAGSSEGWRVRLESIGKRNIELAAFLLFVSLTALCAMNPQSLLEKSVLMALPGFLASVMFSIALPKDFMLSRFFILLGRHSLEIFVVHTIASAGTRVILLHLFSVRDVATHLIFASAAGFIAPALLILVCRRLQLKHVFRFGAVT